MKRAVEQEMSTKAKKKLQQRALSRLVLARSKQQERACRLSAAQQAESRWHKTLRQLTVLGAALHEYEKSTNGNDHPQYVVVFEGYASLLHNRFQVQRWLKRIQRRLEEEQMSYAERHMRWMIDNNCDDHGNPWLE